MQEPFQCLQESSGVLFAARGSSIDSFSLVDGSHLSTWSRPCPSGSNGPVKTPRHDNLTEFSIQNPESLPDVVPKSASPAKRRKLSNDEDGEEAVFEAFGGSGGLTKQTKHKFKQHVAPQTKSEASNVICLLITPDGKYLVAATGEDKTIRVYEHAGAGNLVQLNQRPMPKRPCALALTRDGSTIVCADKFGDVYSLPLLNSRLAVEESDVMGPPKSAFSKSESSSSFKPAANDLTVHSIRNKKALQNQLRQDQQRRGKKEPHLEQKLLLGHVSMLTDISVVEYDGQNYMISADRDEHIRISRGIPQTHVIEGYCLGHSNFVTRLCVLETRKDLLISGGGDDELFVWDWLSGRCLHKVDLRVHVEDLMSEINDKHSANEAGEDQLAESPNIAVSSIKNLSFNSHINENLVIVACERVPAIFVFNLNADSSLSHVQTLRLQRNPLDVVVISSTKTFIVSVDTVHERGSIIRVGSTESHAKGLQMWRMEGTSWVVQPLVFQYEGFGLGTGGEKSFGELSSLLYNLENLRKRSGEE